MTLTGISVMIVEWWCFFNFTFLSILTSWNITEKHFPFSLALWLPYWIPAFCSRLVSYSHPFCCSNCPRFDLQEPRHAGSHVLLMCPVHWGLLYFLPQNLQASACTFQPWNQSLLWAPGRKISEPKSNFKWTVLPNCPHFQEALSHLSVCALSIDVWDCLSPLNSTNSDEYKLC